MAKARRKAAEQPAMPDLRGLLDRAAAPWLAPLREQLAGLRDGGRLPHGLLLLGTAGAGQRELGLWLGALLLCERDGPEPCGRCPGCELFLAGTHPDWHWVRVEEDATVIKVDQVRELAEALGLSSYRGRRKVALIDPADAMNVNAANSLLKTLEEPSGDSVLLLATARPDRLPATVASRCSRISLPLPAAGQGLAWLEEREAGRGWPRLLELCHGAPFRALEQGQAGLEDVDSDMQQAVEAALAGRLDVVVAAEAFAAEQPEMRLDWLESWLTAGLREAAQSSDLVNNNRLPWLRPFGRESMIPAAWRALDTVREARLLFGGSLNRQLLMEGVVISLVELLHPAAAGRRG